MAKTFGQFQESGFDLTQAEVMRFERETIQIYRDAQKSIEAQLDAVYAKLAGIDKADAGYYNELLKRDRLKTILADIVATLNGANTRANTKAVAASKLAVTNNYYRQLYASQWGVDVAFSAIPEEIVELSVFGSAEKWKAYRKSLAQKYGPGSVYQAKEGTLSEILLNNRKKAEAQIRQKITQGLIEGKTLPQMVDSIKDVTGRELVKGGKQVLSGAKASAARIIRTETTRTMNAGAFAQSNYLVSEGIDIQKQWLATLDTRVREQHASLDGVRIEVNDPFRIGGDRALYPGDFGEVGNNVNCRCTTIDVLPDFEPEERRGRDPVTGKTAVFSWQNFDEWASDNGLRRTSTGRLVQG